MGDLVVKRSMNGGRRWKTVSVIESPHYSCWVPDFQFTDERQGTLALDCGEPDEGGPSSWQYTTSNAGSKWQGHAWTPPLVPDESEAELKYEESRTSRCVDGSAWRYDLYPDVVQRRLSGESWETVAELPARFQVAADGLVVPCEGDFGE